MLALDPQKAWWIIGVFAAAEKLAEAIFFVDVVVWTIGVFSAAEHLVDAIFLVDAVVRIIIPGIGPDGPVDHCTRD